MLLGCKYARAQSLRHVTYVGGTALQGNGLHGKLEVTSTDKLVFDGASKLEILYDHVISYESKDGNQLHIGLLTKGIWRLLAPWLAVKQVSLSYRDPDEHSQVVALQMSRGERRCW